MFSWFGKDKINESNNFSADDDYLTPFPVKPLPEKDPETYYSVGLTDNNRVSLSVGKTLFMTSEGVKGMISVLEAAMNSLEFEDDKEIEDDNKDETGTNS